jgi:hypothetical protein
VRFGPPGRSKSLGSSFDVQLCGRGSRLASTSLTPRSGLTHRSQKEPTRILVVFTVKVSPPVDDDSVLTGQLRSAYPSRITTSALSSDTHRLVIDSFKVAFFSDNRVPATFWRTCIEFIGLGYSLHQVCGTRLPRGSVATSYRVFLPVGCGGDANTACNGHDEALCDARRR